MGVSREDADSIIIRDNGSGWGHYGMKFIKSGRGCEHLSDGIGRPESSPYKRAEDERNRERQSQRTGTKDRSGARDEDHNNGGNGVIVKSLVHVGGF